ncbi:MAG: type II toxin-antitoxin system RelE/ParE family toxin [Candidatus Omnitrophota bacterium]|jgi:proteic killer suppression protein|nr:MAG: type II toxin-antitoxin system RelE/ParE family toxin [Candidatus Omnitrophota bacterium]
MIQSFRCKETEKIWNGQRSRKFPDEIQDQALRKLRLLNASQTLDDLKVPPGNHLESLKKDRVGQISIRISDRYRICFIWQGADAYDVEIVDYH